jgi:hypothetical protein
MNKQTPALKKLFAAFSILSLIAIFFTAYFHSTKAKSDNLVQTAQHTFDLANYDIRTDKNVAQMIANLRSDLNDASLASIYEGFKAGEKALQLRVPSLKVEYSQETGAPEIIAPDILHGRAFLSEGDSGQRNAETLRDFLKESSELFGLSNAQINELKITADYTNPDGNLSFAHLEQRINGVPVFQGEVKAGFDKRGAMFRVINNLAAGVNEENISANFGAAENAVVAAARTIKREATLAKLKVASSDNLKTTFERGQFGRETTAEKIYFPLGIGAVRPAWRVLLWDSSQAFDVIVDAATGTLLWRKNITEFQTQAATYNVYGNVNSPLKTLDSPAPLTPGPNAPNGQQAALAPRTSFTLIGNEPPYGFNTSGWIPDGANETAGNNAEAGIDRDGTDGIDPSGKAYGTPYRVFNYVYNPSPGNPAPGEEPLPVTQIYPPTQYQQGSITNAFYVVNRFHDETYLLGFTEAARNFQLNNFGRGGAGNDRISVEVQDSMGNINFSAPADGTGGKLQVPVFTASTPDRDGALDAQIIVHELTHGLSNRLHGNSSGLNSNMARGMGEGWSDFYALALLSEPTDDPLGLHGIAAYSFGGSDFSNNYYYGIRRFPYAVIAATGPNGKPHSPLTFRHLNSNCNTEIGTPTTIGTISAYPRGPIGVAQCDQVHNAGEIWALALWEVRGQLITNNGATTGNRKALQFITDGMKLAPLNPTFLQERDAILTAAQVSGTAQDVRDVWRGSALRGMGTGAQVITASPANVVESFQTPNLTQTPQFTFTDPAPGGNGNGNAEQGETIQLNIPLTNQSGNAATNVTLQIAGGNSASYGDVANGQTVTRTVSFTVPTTACGQYQLTFNVNSNLGAVTFTRFISVGFPFVSLSQNFDGVIAPALPGGWTQTPVATNPGWTTATGAADSAPNSARVPNPASGGGADLETPVFTVTSPNQRIVFRNNYNTEATWDGGVLEIKVGAGAYQDILAAGGTFVEGGYNGTLRGTGNPLANRQGWTGNSNGYINTIVQLPQSAAGQNVQLRFRIGHDTAGGGTGWNIDNVQVFSLVCGDPPQNKARADFDGDGKTDVSAVRDGNWYVLRSTSGFIGASWGAPTDKILGGDFNGDFKADYAVFRPNASGGATFYILNSTSGTFQSISWGLPNDIPVIQDYDGDGRDDVAVYRLPSGVNNAAWYVLTASGSFIAITPQAAALNTDKPIIGDFDGDNKGDATLYRDGTWFVQKSGGGLETIQWGAPEDKPVAADYDGDGKDDIAVYRPSIGTWCIRKSSGGNLFIPFGSAADVPVPGNYDGDGQDDVAVFRDGFWYINRSAGGVTSVQFGINGDKPVPAAYIP